MHIIFVQDDNKSVFEIKLLGAVNMYEIPSNKTNFRRCSGSWNRPNPCEQFEEYENESSRKCGKKNDSECENTINIINKVCINQDANAQGGDGGNGGDAENGKATGGSAAAASGLIAIAANVKDPEIEIPVSDDLKKKDESELETEQANGSGAAATGGSATIGTSAGGAGGAGGNGGTAENNATVAIENVVIISCNSDTPNGVCIGTNSKTLDIKVDKDGNTFVNGEKMDEKKLSDGTKVLIFRSSNSEK
jgi:hypothetical protein